MKKMMSVSRVGLRLFMLLLVFFCGIDGTAIAAGTGDIDLSRTGSITVALTANEALGEKTAVHDGTLNLYHVADLTLPDWNMAYELTEAFSGFSGKLDMNRSTLADELAAYAENAPGAVMSTAAAIDGNGTAVFEDLPLGLYLVTQGETSTGFYAIDPFLVTVPLEEGSDWVYDVNASPKTEVDPNSVKSVDTDGDNVYDNDGDGVSVGDVLSYEITYTNGYGEACDVVITDVLDPGLTYVSSSPRADVSADGEGNTVLTWTMSHVAAYSSGSVTFTALVNEDALTEGGIENTAEVRIGEKSASTNETKNPVLVPLEISKVVSDPGGRADGNTYQFEITLAKDGAPVAGPVSVAYLDGTAGFVVFDPSGTAVVALGAGETVTLRVPWGSDVSVTELTTGADSVTVHLDGERVVYIEDSESQASAHIGTVADSTQVEFVNAYREYFGIDEEIVTDTVDIFDYDNWIKDESVNEYNAIEIEMSTMLPVVTAEDLVNGSFTMDFHNVLDSEIILDEVDADFSVYLTRSDGSHVQVGHEYYTVTIDPDDGCSFHVDVDLTRMYLDGIIDESDLTGETMLTIFFFADLEGTDLNGSYRSTVWYDIYDGEEWLYTSNVDVVYVFTFDIMVTKYDAETMGVLSGAEFGIYYDPDCEDPVSRNGGPYTEICDGDGVADFYGLGENTYYIKELAAPDGYELSDEIVEIEVGLGYDPGIDGVIDPAELRYEIRFADYPIAGNPPSPAAEATPTPSPAGETTPTPSPIPEVTPTPEPEITPAPEDSPEPAPVPEATPSPAPSPTPTPEVVTPGGPNDTTPSGGTTTTINTSEALPQTGMIFWPIILLAAAGAALVCAGLILKKRQSVA